MNDRQTKTNIQPDANYPDMWRVLWPDGHLSDMVNKARALEVVRIAEEQKKAERL